MTGKISKVIATKGFGFIAGDDGQEYFVHRSAFQGGVYFERLPEGETVTFDPGLSDKGLRAENARVEYKRVGQYGTQRSVNQTDGTSRPLICWPLPPVEVRHSRA